MTTRCEGAWRLKRRRSRHAGEDICAASTRRPPVLSNLTMSAMRAVVDEVRRILLLGFPPDVKPLEAHGYRQSLQYLRGNWAWTRPSSTPSATHAALRQAPVDLVPPRARPRVVRRFRRRRRRPAGRPRAGARAPGAPRPPQQGAEKRSARLVCMKRLRRRCCLRRPCRARRRR